MNGHRSIRYSKFEDPTVNTESPVGSEAWVKNPGTLERGRRLEHRVSGSTRSG